MEHAPWPRLGGSAAAQQAEWLKYALLWLSAVDCSLINVPQYRQALALAPAAQPHPALSSRALPARPPWLRCWRKPCRTHAWARRIRGSRRRWRQGLEQVGAAPVAWGLLLARLTAR